MKYSELHNTIKSLRELADFLETNPRAIELPSLRISSSTYPSVYGYAYNEAGEYKYGIDEEKSRARAKKVAKALKGCEKKWDDNCLRLKKKFGDIELTFTFSREAVCKRVVTGEERVEAVFIPATTRETVEWVCEETSLLA